MGAAASYMMERRNASTLEPHPLIHKFNNYGVNNEAFGAATDTCSAVYRVKNCNDDVFSRLCESYYYKGGDTVRNLKALCAMRGDTAAIAYRPVVGTEMIDVEQKRSGRAEGATRTTGARHVNPLEGLHEGQRGTRNRSDDTSGASQLPEPRQILKRCVTHYGPRVTMSYAELWTYIERFGVGLAATLRDGRHCALSNAQQAAATVDESNASHGCCESVKGFDAPKIALFEETRWEWISSIFGLWTQQYVAVTAYANLGEEALCQALTEAQVVATVCNGKSVPLLWSLLRQGKIPPAVLIYLDALPMDWVHPAEVEGQGGEGLLVKWTDVVARGAALTAEDQPLPNDESEKEEQEEQEEASLVRPEVSCEEGLCYDPQGDPGRSSVTQAAKAKGRPCRPRPGLPPSNDHLALIMYTSGTTDNPKGVMHTHGSIVAGVDTLNDKLVWIEPFLPKDGQEQTYCAFLPLAHIMEFVCITIFLHRGFLVCFSNPRTLTGEYARPHGDFEEYKPLIVMAVPRIFDVIRKAVLSKLPPEGTLKHGIFMNAYASRLKALREGKETPYYNAKVFAKLRHILGGRTVLLLSGGGPLSEATQEFTNVCLGLMVQGYGLTETIACGATQIIGSLEYNNVGQLMKGCEVKLLDTAEFKHTDTPEPRGELLMRGLFLFKGYYKQSALTAESLDKDGWFHTGDVASIASNTNGVLRIIGRVKALAKNSLGEYVAVEALEAIYAGNSLSLPNSACVLVHPHRNYICAIALTDAALVEQFLAKYPRVAQQVSTIQYPQILSDDIFKSAVTESFQVTATEAHRPRHEVVRSVQLLSDEWTIENDMLTAAMKLKRRVIDVAYHTLITDLFQEE